MDCPLFSIFDKIYKGNGHYDSRWFLYKKETIERLHNYCQRGEKHDNLVNRLIDVCKKGEKDVNLSEETVKRLLDFYWRGRS